MARDAGGQQHALSHEAPTTAVLLPAAAPDPGTLAATAATASGCLPYTACICCLPSAACLLVLRLHSAIFHVGHRVIVVPHTITVIWQSHLRVPCFVQPRDFLAFAITTRAPLPMVGAGRTQLLNEPAQHKRDGL